MYQTAFNLFEMFSNKIFMTENCAVTRVTKKKKTILGFVWHQFLLNGVDKTIADIQAIKFVLQLSLQKGNTII